MSVPPATISAQRKSYSSCEPSTQWMAAGSVSSAIFSTHFFKCSFLLSGDATLRVLVWGIVFSICDGAIFQNSRGQAAASGLAVTELIICGKPDQAPVFIEAGISAFSFQD